MRILAFLFGLILLFPGVCAFGFMAVGVTTLPPLGSAQWGDSSIWAIILFAAVGWGFCFLVSFGGIMMMRGALKPSQARREGDPGDRQPPT